jgi:hypothetical protein
MVAPLPHLGGAARAGVTSGEPILVIPAELDPQRWATARCNDGTPFGFMLELSPDGSRDWVIYLEGGAFCDDYAKDCDDRSERMSTTPGEQAIEDYYRTRDKALFSSSPSSNPSFHNANKAWAFYCSSDVWSGDTVERRSTTADPEGWYFSGRSNVRALFEVLKTGYGLDDADPSTRILYAGGSAGGEGVQATADIASKLLPKSARYGRLKLLNDAGSVFVYDDPDHRFARTDSTFKEVLMLAYDFWGSRLNPRCEKAARLSQISPAECFDEVVVHPSIVEPRPHGLGLPLFVQHSSVDGFQVRVHDIDEPEDLEFFRSTILERFDEVAWTWLFSGGDLSYHVVTIRDDRWTMGPEGSSFRDVLTRYWEGGPPEIVIYGNP